MVNDNHFNTTGYSNEKFSKMLDAGFTVKEIEKAWSDEEYRREYNQRPEVKAKRAAYNAKRWQRTKEIRAISRG
jgi:hypothetical protein